MTSGFCCPVCGAALTAEAGRLVCGAGHCYDLAKEGYVNLLPANRKHSKDPGDDRQMVAARTLFLDGGYYEPLRTALCGLLRAGTAADAEETQRVLLDAGCGEGWYTAAMAAGFPGRTLGVDLSKSAVKKAAKRCRAAGVPAEIAVASVYRLPVADASVDAVVNCFSPLAAAEYRRVLRPGGRFLYVIPGPRHLWELKQLLYDAPYENEERSEDYPGLELIETVPVQTRFTLETPELIAALFHMTPYTWKTPRDGAERLRTVQRLTVQAQFRICLYRRKEK